MTIVTVSKQFQLALPSDLVLSPGLVAGDQLAVLNHEGRLTLVPIKPMSSMKGFLAGIDTTIERSSLHNE